MVRVPPPLVIVPLASLVTSFSMPAWPTLPLIELSPLISISTSPLPATSTPAAPPPPLPAAFSCRTVTLLKVSLSFFAVLLMISMTPVRILLEFTELAELPPASAVASAEAEASFLSSAFFWSCCSSVSGSSAFFWVFCSSVSDSSAFFWVCCSSAAGSSAFSWVFGSSASDFSASFWVCCSSVSGSSASFSVVG